MFKIIVFNVRFVKCFKANKLCFNNNQLLLDPEMVDHCLLISVFVLSVKKFFKIPN